jgi:hypothetical protein
MTMVSIGKVVHSSMMLSALKFIMCVSAMIEHCAKDELNK